MATSAATRQRKGPKSENNAKHMGFSHSFLSKCETGERRIDMMELLQLAKLYRKSPQYFLNLD